MQTNVKTDKVTEVESNLPSEMLKAAMEAKFGKENVEVKTAEDGTKKLIVKNGDKETEFSLGEDADTATKDSENRDAQATKDNNGVSAEGDPDVDKKPADGSEPKDFSEDQNDEIPDPSMTVDEAVNELAEAKNQLSEVENELKNKVEDPNSDPEEVKDLKEERDHLERKVENFSRTLAPIADQINFSNTQDGDIVNFSEGEYMFSKDGQDYYFSDSDDENIFLTNGNGEEFMCSHENFSNLIEDIQKEINFSNEQVQNYLAQFNFSNEQGNFSCIGEDEGHRYFSNDEGEEFAQEKTPEEIQAWRDYQDELDDQAAAGEANPDDVTPPEDADNNGKVEIDPEKFYVVSVKGAEDGSAELAIGQVYLTKEGAEAEAGAVAAGEGETIEVLKGDELLEKYGSAFEPETPEGQEVNNCGVNCSDDDENGIPVAVTDTNNIPVTDLEKGDKVITPYGDEGELLEDINPGDEEAKVYIPADDKVVEVPMDEFRKNFSAIVSIHDYINQTNFSEGGEGDSDKGKSDDKPAEDETKDAEKKEENEKVAKAEEELEKIKKDEAEKSIDGNKATIAEVKAVAKNEVEKQKEDIIQQAAQETVAAIAPALQGQGQPEAPTEQAPAPDQGQEAPVEAGAEGAQPQGEPAPTQEEVAAAQAAQATPAQTQAPVEGQPAAEDQGQQVNHSLLLASANASAMRNFSKSGMSSYSNTLTACYRRGKQAN